MLLLLLSDCSFYCQKAGKKYNLNVTSVSYIIIQKENVNKIKKWIID